MKECFTNKLSDNEQKHEKYGGNFHTNLKVSWTLSVMIADSFLAYAWGIRIALGQACIKLKMKYTHLAWVLLSISMY